MCLLFSKKSMEYAENPKKSRQKLIYTIMFTKKFIKVSKVKKLQDAELQKIKGGEGGGVTLPLYGIKPLYGITPLYGIKE